MADLQDTIDLLVAQNRELLRNIDEMRTMIDAIYDKIELKEREDMYDEYEF